MTKSKMIETIQNYEEETRTIMREREAKYGRNDEGFKRLWASWWAIRDLCERLDIEI